MRVPELELELEFEFNATAELELELVNSSVALVWNDWWGHVHEGVPAAVAC